MKKLIRYLAPLTIVLIAAIFIYNIVTNGYIQHPGKTSYQKECAQCHGDKGEGIKSLIPPLIDADFAIQNIDSIPCWIKNGLNHPITVNGKLYDQPMYPISIDEIQTANIINYISREFLKNKTEVNSAWVKEKWNNCP
ncbi:MAG: cytochrome c [Chitinophagales bacterium]|nr:cytochrome c [Chitinophagales bacterium]